jgi:glycosyltransferase involved in cell wall biosynthesis
VDVERVPGADRLRIAVFGDFDSVHTRSWLRWFIDRGHDLHAVSFYTPRADLPGVTLHVLSPSPGRRAASQTTSAAVSPSLAARLPRGISRLVHALRYQRAGLRRTLRAIDPDVVHAHFLVEHGFYGAVAGVHPYVVTTWGSDVLVEPSRDLISNRIARWTIARADAITSNNTYMAERLVVLGAKPAQVEVVTLGADRYDLEGRDASVNLRDPDPVRAPVVLSTRAHEALYNISEIIDACSRVAASRPELRLRIAHGGTLTSDLRGQAARTAGNVEFLGLLDRAAFRDALHDAEIFVSIPDSDGTSVALLQAMAAGCFPIVSDLPSQRELVEDGVTGFRVPLHRPDMLAARIEQALADPALRRRAAARNLISVEQRGLNESEMQKMESIYHPLAGEKTHQRDVGAVS